MNLQMLSGRQALECVNSGPFQSKWKALFDDCHWATACQHPDFVGPWYEFYHSTFLPVIVFEERADGSLAGLLTLALRHQGRQLTGAGEQQAEYQGWIQAPGTDGGFIVQAIRKLRTAFPGVDLYLKYLPSEIPLDWIDKEESIGGLCSLNIHSRPIMKADPAAMGRQRNKKNQRQNYNRLNRLGGVQFRRVLEHEDFIRVFGEIRDQYDFRQAALYHSTPFLSDPRKRLFYTELHKRGLLHATVLSVGTEVAASHIGLLSRGRAVHLGINTHGPAFAAHSPGNLLLAMLGVHLGAEKIDLLDLTPGGDEYKEHFATDHDSVVELTVYSGTSRRLRTDAFLRVKRFAKARLRKAGYRPADVLAAFDKVKRFGSSGLQSWYGKWRAKRDFRPCEFRYCRPQRPAAAGKLAISRNRLQDVFKFDPDGASVSFCGFMAMVMKQMERSQHLYSFVQDDILRIFCWVRMCNDAPAGAGGASIVISGLYVHDRLKNDELVRCFLEQLLCELNELNANASVHYRGVLSSGLQNVVKRCGFIDATLADNSDKQYMVQGHESR